MSVSARVGVRCVLHLLSGKGGCIPEGVDTGGTVFWVSNEMIDPIHRIKGTRLVGRVLKKRYVHAWIEERVLEETPREGDQ